MGKGYIIENYKVINQDEYIPPVQTIHDILRKYNGRFLVATPKSTTLSGNPLEVILVIEFNSNEMALKFYNSLEYAKYKELYERTTSGWILHSEAYAKK